MKYLLTGKELKQGEVELYRQFSQTNQQGDRVFYNLVLGGRITLTLNASDIYYNMDGTGTIATRLRDNYPKSYWDVETKQRVEITPANRQEINEKLAKILKANGFEEKEESINSNTPSF